MFLKHFSSWRALGARHRRTLPGAAPALLALLLVTGAMPGCLFSENFAEKPLRTSANSGRPDAGQTDSSVVDNNTAPPNNQNNNNNVPSLPTPEGTYVMPVSATGRARSSNYQLQLRVGEGGSTGSAQSPSGAVRLGGPAALPASAQP